MIITQIGRKQLGGHRACLGDIMQKSLKRANLVPRVRSLPGSRRKPLRTKVDQSSTVLELAHNFSS